MVETLSAVSTAASISWAVGTGIGTVAYDLMERYSPDTLTTIGGTFQEMVNQMNAATMLLAAGQVEASVGALFNLPSSQRTPMSHSGGDFSTTEGWTTYYANSGGSSCPRGEKCPPPQTF